MFRAETPFAQLDARGWAEFNWGCRGSAVRGDTNNAVIPLLPQALPVGGDHGK